MTRVEKETPTRGSPKYGHTLTRSDNDQPVGQRLVLDDPVAVGGRVTVKVDPEARFHPKLDVPVMDDQTQVATAVGFWLLILLVLCGETALPGRYPDPSSERSKMMSWVDPLPQAPAPGAGPHPMAHPGPQHGSPSWHT